MHQLGVANRPCARCNALVGQQAFRAALTVMSQYGRALSAGATDKSDCSISSRKARWKVMNGTPLWPCTRRGRGQSAGSCHGTGGPLAAGHWMEAYQGLHCRGRNMVGRRTGLIRAHERPLVHAAAPARTRRRLPGRHGGHCWPQSASQCTPGSCAGSRGRGAKGCWLAMGKWQHRGANGY